MQVLVPEIQWTLASHPLSTKSVEEILDHIHHRPFRAPICAAILKFDCSQHKVTRDETVCGTDQVTYHNYCVFAKASCQVSSTIELDHKGQCVVTSSSASHSTIPSSVSHMTTSTPSSVTWGHDPGYDLIKDVFCTNINAIICGNNVDADLCATDGKVYTNQCLFAKVKCFKPDLETASPSTCHENGLPLKSTPSPIVG
ncbi:tomoregulin-2-like [Haliotis asinina]|uniref:tomoregulin-2-like n=1 Tax=Haliotis asinina TaxID=109174 RepID=UPI003531A532